MKKHAESHMDHGFTQAQWDFIFAKYADKTEPFRDTFELPAYLGTVSSELYGPSVGDSPIAEDDVFYARRGVRPWKSRLTMLPHRPTRFIRVIARTHEETCDRCGGAGEHDTVNGFMHCVQCGGRPGTRGTGIRKHACILHTAYGVMRIDVPPSSKEPGDIEAQIAACTAAMCVEKDVLADVLIPQLAEARTFWSTHALVAPLDVR